MHVEVIVVFATEVEDTFMKGDGGRRSAFLPRGEPSLVGPVLHVIQSCLHCPVG
jgi:hypothetical protein